MLLYEVSSNSLITNSISKLNFIFKVNINFIICMSYSVNTKILLSWWVTKNVGLFPRHCCCGFAKGECFWCSHKENIKNFFIGSNSISCSKKQTFIQDIWNLKSKLLSTSLLQWMLMWVCSIWAESEIPSLAHSIRKRKKKNFYPSGVCWRTLKKWIKRKFAIKDSNFSLSLSLSFSFSLSTCEQRVIVAVLRW